ncbi:hypothetical protein [Streptomyces bacillaris]|uniref:hypothetical protein n=1 Tax=Streptomyces bacillaris TaxID=68179 RepID=UPI00380B6B4A
MNAEHRTTTSQELEVAQDAGLRPIVVVEDEMDVVQRRAQEEADQRYAELRRLMEQPRRP